MYSFKGAINFYVHADDWEISKALISKADCHSSSKTTFKFNNFIYNTFIKAVEAPEYNTYEIYFI